MIPAWWLALLGGVVFWAGWHWYSRYLAVRLFRLDAALPTPAHRYRDDLDFLPTHRFVLWGHHFTSVAGAAPIIGPAIAIIWGWLPAFLWILFGTVFLAGIHDLGTLWASVRHEGRSMGALTRQAIGPRARSLFLFIIFFLLLMVNAVFAVAIATLFIKFPAAVLPYWLQVPVAIGIGVLVYRRGVSVLPLALLGLLLLLGLIGVGIWLPVSLPSAGFGVPASAWWVLLMLGYGALASRLPVWLLLQPRDFLNAHMLFVVLALLYLGIFIGGATMAAPALNTPPADTPSLWPLLFVTVACGAISGFHGLVSSGTSSKQLDRETDARFVGYLGATGEGLLALAALLATAAGLGGREAWQGHYGSWAEASGSGIAAFVTGAGNLLAVLGLPPVVGTTAVAIMVVAFAATTLDTSMRLQRFILAEIGAEYRLPALQNANLATLLTFASCAALAFLADPANPGGGGMVLWPLFGTTNQLTAGLSLLVLTLLLRQLGRNYLLTLLPFIFVATISAWSMCLNVLGFVAAGNGLLVAIGVLILILNLWLLAEGLIALRRQPAAPLARE